MENARSKALPLFFAIFAALVGTSHVDAFSASGRTWPAGSVVVMQMELGSSPVALKDGSPTWNAAAAPSLDYWNRLLGRFQFVAVPNSILPVSSGDRINSISFADSVFGQSFGANTLAVTYYLTQNNTTVEADVLFNKAMPFDSYRGPLQFRPNGTCLNDLPRVLVHELGHALGLDHPDAHGQNVDAIMNSVEGDNETPTVDDTTGAQSLYGPATGPAPTPAPTAIPAPTAMPTPTPAPVATPRPSTPPTPTPAPTPNATPGATPVPGATPPIIGAASTSHLANISTRMQVGAGDKVLIAGFIVNGSSPKKIIIRAAGPSLKQYGIDGAMNDPMLSLHDSKGAMIAQNDNWQQSEQAGEIADARLNPAHPLESAILATLPPGSYTAILRGVNESTGVALVEGYEIDQNTTRMINVSTRGQVGTGDDVMIGGFNVQGTSPKKVVVRALGPTLGAAGIDGALENPILELRDSAGNQVALNDDWSTGPRQAEIFAANVAPPDPREPAILANLAPGNYTAIVRGVGNTTGVGLVEVYDLD